MIPSGSRKMRRPREVAAVSSSSNNDEQQHSASLGFHLFDVRGEATTALGVFSASANSNETRTFLNQYNCALLEHLTKQSASEAFLNDLESFETDFEARKAKEQNTISARKRKRNELILAYNKALVLHASGENVKSASCCAKNLADMIASRQKVSDELSAVASRMGFLLLECMLQFASRNDSSTDFRKCMDTAGIPPLDKIVEWIELFDTEKDPQIKFLLTLYKSRLGLAAVDDSGKHVESKIRSARKDLKQAMDIFQHKLRPSFDCGEAASVVSSANSEENMSTSTPQQETQQPPPSSVILQKYNQSALNLKANLEQVKGNTKKSLILCSEALAVAENPSYEAVHSNNLAVVYGTKNKRHLALHALSKSLRASEDSSAIFHSDGTARPDYSVMMLHNASICALQTRSFLSAYECMATCVVRSDVFRNRPRCWLRMAEACMGLFSQTKSQNSNKINLSPIEINGKPKGLVVDNNLYGDEPEIQKEELVTILASSEDLEQVKRNPLLRARGCLERVLQDETGLGHDALVSVRLTLAYIYLTFREYGRALEIVKLVLSANGPSEDDDELIHRMWKRRMATAKMYAAEASCYLGDTMNAMKYLVGDGKDDAFDRLASDLGGVTLETAAANGEGKRRLARAQTTVRSSASAVTAVLGNLTAAKQLAMSAQSMEDAYASNQGQSSARRALIYCLLRGGQHGPALNALNLLTSLR